MKNYLALIGLIMFISCGIKPSGSGSGNKLYETFYAGEQGTQYFIKPLYFTGNKKESIAFDFTFRYNNKVNAADSSIVNFTLTTLRKTKNIDSVTVKNPNAGTSMKSFRHLFSEKDGDYFITRFTTSVPVSDLEKLFGNTEWTVQVYTPEYQSGFTPAGKTAKKINKIRDRIFSLF